MTRKELTEWAKHTVNRIFHGPHEVKMNTTVKSFKINCDLSNELIQNNYITVDLDPNQFPEGTIVEVTIQKKY